MGDHLPGPLASTTLTRKPLLLYGTSRKENRTRHLTETALNIGFTAVDTANYPSAYNEPHTGDGIAAAIKSGVIKRKDLFVGLWSADCRLIAYADLSIDPNQVLAFIRKPEG